MSRFRNSLENILTVYNMEKILTVEQFTNFTQGEGLRIVKIGAGWCNPCRLIEQVFEEILPIDNVTVAEVDMDDAEEDIAVINNVRNIPTVLFYKDGLLIDRFTGMIGREAIENKIKENLAK